MKLSMVQDREALECALISVGAEFDREKCTCPFHNDRNPSAGIFRDEIGHWRFRCFVCDITLDYYDVIAWREGLDIVEVLRVEPKKEREKYVYESYEAALGDYTLQHEYTDAQGRLLTTKLRTFDAEKGKKSYRIVSPYYGGFIREGPKLPWPLYNLTGLNVGGKKGLVVVEGEKCADALAEMGFAVTTAMSSTGIDQTDWTPVYGRNIVIWPDNDSTGQKYADGVERLLMPHCTVVRVDPVALGLGEKEDVVDYIERGHGSDDIREVLMGAMEHTPSAGVASYIEGMIDGSISAIEWPWPLLHKFSQALLPGTVTILCGRREVVKAF